MIENSYLDKLEEYKCVTYKMLYADEEEEKQKNMTKSEIEKNLIFIFHLLNFPKGPIGYIGVSNSYLKLTEG